jgi:hypothetical protein
VCKIFKFLPTKPSTINQLPLSENALKLAYGNAEFHNFPGEDPRTPRSKGREREGGRSGREKRGGDGEGRGWGSRKGRDGTEGLKGREGKRRKRRRGKGEEFGPPSPMFQTDRRHCRDVSSMSPTKLETSSRRLESDAHKLRA